MQNYRYILGREFRDPLNPEGEEIAQEWGEYGIGRQEAIEWKRHGFGPDDANAWLSHGFGPLNAKEWAEITGKDAPDVAAWLAASGDGPEAYADYSYQEIMDLMGEEVAEN